MRLRFFIDTKKSCNDRILSIQKYSFRMKKLLFVVNVDWFFDSHRLPIALKAIEDGFDVYLATTVTNLQLLDKFSQHGINVFPLFVDRGAKNMISIPFLLFDLFRIFKLLNPDIVHLVTLQPVIFGGIIARFLRIKSVVYAISGLGHFFLTNSMYTQARRYLILALYKIALANPTKKVIFQNNRDRDILIRNCGLQLSDSCVLPGSGVDLSIFSFQPLPIGIPTVLMACRLLKSKGVHDFVEAASILKRDNYEIRFVLVGQPDVSNPSSVTEAELTKWNDDGNVEILGFRSDLPYLMSLSHIVVLPSYYPEGLPKVLCEAAACGRPVITTVEPGCIDAIQEGKTGLAVPSRSPLLLAEAILQLAYNKDLLYEMSCSSRRFAEEKFCVDHIARSHISIYNKLSHNESC
ncbi:putative alpha-galactosyltransferase [Synechococcus sp. A18-40]|nr:putative alpha-galactosyltransferase [Synechococcus sp. A18-40]